jgi:hypothetical protein
VVEGNTNYGTLYGLNCYDAAPEMGAQLKPGEIKRVRLIEGMVQPGDAPFGKGTLMVPRRLVGEAPVESDGSFNLVAPSDTPMQVQTLDERGMALATSGWIWLKSKETRGCIGCHEDPERIPENEYVEALRRPSTQLVLPPAQRRLLTFKEHIAPMLAQHCASAQCHGGKASRLRLPATSGTWAEAQMQKAFAALVPEKGQGYVQPGKARLSPMLWQLVSTNTTRPWDLAAGKRLPKASKPEHKLPPGKSELLPATDLTTLVQWIDMGAQYTAPAPTAVRTNLAKLP